MGRKIKKQNTFWLLDLDDQVFAGCQLWVPRHVAVTNKTWSEREEQSESYVPYENDTNQLAAAKTLVLCPCFCSISVE